MQGKHARLPSLLERIVAAPEGAGAGAGLATGETAE